MGKSIDTYKKYTVSYNFQVFKKQIFTFKMKTTEIYGNKHTFKELHF